MVNVGCKFGPNDLSPQQWDELIVLAHERQYVDERVRKQRDGELERERAINKLQQAARQEQGIPPPGGSLFPRKTPVQ